MTYQELVDCYPWIDLVLELFKGIMPTMVALFAIFKNNSLSQKRDLMHRKKAMELDYLEKVLSWIHEIKNEIFNTSQAFEKALVQRDFQVRVEKCNEARAVLSRMNTSIATWNDTYNDIMESFEHDIKLKHFKQATMDFTERLIEIEQKCIKGFESENVTDEINEVVRNVNSEINENIVLIVEQINLLYESK